MKIITIEEHVLDPAVARASAATAQQLSPYSRLTTRPTPLSASTSSLGRQESARSVRQKESVLSNEPGRLPSPNVTSVRPGAGCRRR
jgi:hypothetical protein